MSDAVPVFHPAPIQYVPRGGRQERLGFLGLVTPVRLAEADPDGFEPLGTLAHGAESAYARGTVVRDRPLYARDGGIWMDLHGGDERPLPRAELAAFLASPDPIPRENPHDLGFFFHGTPVMATPEAFDRLRSSVKPEGIRNLASDGSERARADLSRFLADEVAIVAGTVRVRLHPVARLAYDRASNLRWHVSFACFPQQGYVPPGVGPLEDPRGLVERLRRTRALQRMHGEIEEPGERDPVAVYGIEGSTGPFPFHLARGSTVRLFANACHGAALRLTVVQEALLNAGREGGLPDPVARILPRARAWQALGAVGGIRADETVACLDDFRTLCLALREAFPRPGNSPSLERLLGGIETEALPDLRDAAAPPPEDAAALAGLGFVR